MPAEKRLNEIYKTNAGYFAHLNRKCLCGICTCGHCKCDHPRSLCLNLPECNKNSLYQETYHPHKNAERSTAVKMDATEFRSSNANPDSIYRNDYKPHDKESLNCNEPMFQKNRGNYNSGLENLKAPVPKESTYKENYPNWKNTTPPVMIRPPLLKTVDGRLPFFAKPSSHEYGQFPHEKFDETEAIKIKTNQKMYKNPLWPEAPFIGQTVNSSTFQPPANSQALPKVLSKQMFNHNAPAFENQFKTSSMAHDGVQPTKCPAREIIDRTRIQNLENSIRMVKNS